MKRDMNLVRAILLDATSQENGYVKESPNIDDYTPDQVAHHVYLMWKAGLVEAADTSDSESPSPQALLLSVTWQGHEFIDAARSETVWNKAMGKVSNAGGSMTIGIIKDLLVHTARQQFGLES
ncbi:DUF2513 domain-containing protein [Vreelandella sp. EE27]